MNENVLQSSAEITRLALDAGYDGCRYLTTMEYTWKSARLGDAFPANDLKIELDQFTSALGSLESCFPNWEAVELRTASVKLWKVTVQMWQGPKHRERIELKATLGVDFRGHAFAGDYPVLQELARFSTALRQLSFGRLSEKMVGLGAAIAGLGWVPTELFDDADLFLIQSVRPVIADVPTLIKHLSANLPHLQNLDIDVDKRAYYLDPRADDISYYAWLDAKLDQLLPEISWAVREHEAGDFRAATSRDALWIGAADAVEVAQALDYKVSLSQISKLCDCPPSPFQWRKPSQNRREIHLPSFVCYVLQQREGGARDDETAYKAGVAERIAASHDKRHKQRGNLD